MSGVEEPEPGGGPAFDDQEAPVDGSVVAAADQDQVVLARAAAVGLGLEVVHVQARAVATAGHSALALVPADHLAARPRWDALAGARRGSGHTHMGILSLRVRRQIPVWPHGPDVLGVAQGHLDHLVAPQPQKSTAHIFRAVPRPASAPLLRAERIRSS